MKSLMHLLLHLFFVTFFSSAFAAEKVDTYPPDTFPREKFKERRGGKLHPDCIIESTKRYELGDVVMVVFADSEKASAISVAIDNANPEIKGSHVKLKDSQFCSFVGQIYVFGTSEFGKIVQRKKKDEVKAVQSRADNLKSFVYGGVGLKIVSLTGLHYRAPYADKSSMQIPAAEVHLRHYPFTTKGLENIGVEANLQIARTLTPTTIASSSSEVGTQNSQMIKGSPVLFYRISMLNRSMDMIPGFAPYFLYSLKHTAQAGIKASPFRDFTMSGQSLRLWNAYHIGSVMDIVVDLSFDLLPSANTPVVKDGDSENSSPVKSPTSFSYALGTFFNINKYFVNVFYKGSQMSGTLSYVSGDSIKMGISEHFVLLGGGLRW